MRQHIARISKSKAALVGAAAVAAAAVIGTTVGYASMGTDVTLNVDGHIEHVTATGDTVGQVLSDQGISLQSHDEVAPAVDQPVSDGTTIAVRYGKPLQLDVDGTHLDLLGDGHRRPRSAERDQPQLRPRTPVGQPWRGHHPRRSPDHRGHAEDAHRRDRRPACRPPDHPRRHGRAGAEGAGCDAGQARPRASGAASRPRRRRQARPDPGPDPAEARRRRGGRLQHRHPRRLLDARGPQHGRSAPATTVAAT